MNMKTKEQYFEEYSNLYQFEEGSPEYLIDREDFLNCMEQYGKLMYNQGVSDSLGTAVQESGWITDKIIENILKLKK